MKTRWEWSGRCAEADGAIRLRCTGCGILRYVGQNEDPGECDDCFPPDAQPASRTVADVAWDAINWFGSAVTTLASAVRSMKRAECEDWRTFDKHARDMYEAHGRLLADRRASLTAGEDVGHAARRAASVDLDEIARALDLGPDRDLPAAVRLVRNERNAAREARAEALRQRDRCAQEAAEARAERDQLAGYVEAARIDGPRYCRERDEAVAVAREALRALGVWLGRYEQPELTEGRDGNLVTGTWAVAEARWVAVGSAQADVAALSARLDKIGKAPAPVLCVGCGRAIDPTGLVVDDDAGPMHVGCAPAADDAWPLPEPVAQRIRECIEVGDRGGAWAPACGSRWTWDTLGKRRLNDGPPMRVRVTREDFALVAPDGTITREAP